MSLAPTTAPDAIAPTSAATLVSVIIPTFNRPRLVLRAVASALAQTHLHLEIIVVIDGQDEATVRSLAAVSDPRLRVMQNADHVGAGKARDLAVAEARGAWIAALDDDDEWLPEKLEAQLRYAAGQDEVILSCLARIVTPLATYVWPTQVYDNRQPLDEYLFDRRSVFRGRTSMMTSTLVLPRQAVAALSFGAVPQHEEIGLLLRASKSLGLKIVTVPESLAVVHTEEARPSLGTGFPWRGSLAWLDSMGLLITRRAYSGFCLTHLSAEAASAGDYLAFPKLLALAFRRGAPTAMQLIMFFTFWLVPKGLRRRGRALFSRARQAAWP